MTIITQSYLTSSLENSKTAEKNVIALSFDVEDWFTVRNMRGFIAEDDWDKQEMRVQIGIDFILEEFAKKKIKATFFILGWIAERASQLVKKIDRAGHEICSHGYSHTPIDLLDPDQFELDLKKSLGILEKIIGRKIKGFRAPSFSITKNTFWAVDILAKYGIEYDSSIFSIAHPDYGIKNFPSGLTNLGPIQEVSLRKWNFWGLQVPLCGGGYFRLCPYALIKSALLKTLKQESVVMYFHPWEFDFYQPRIALSMVKHFRHYVGLKNNKKKFIELLNDFEFTTIEDLIRIETKKMDYTRLPLI